ncbi:MAG: LuxR C-terminal-related transcriptional regulator [Bacteroidales bacterium]|jgi:DNA-binding CsgD family transcriptional regulator
MKQFSKNDQRIDHLNDSETTNELTKNILNEINAFIFVFDLENLKPLWINNYFTRRIGYTNNDLQRISKEEFLNLFHPDSLTLFKNRINYVTKNPNREVKTVYQLRSKNQDWIYLLTSSRIFKKNKDGNIKYLIGHAFEVNPYELKRHLNEITRLKRRCDNLSLISLLGRREVDIIHLISCGFTDKEISSKLNISIHTTKTHRKKIIQKLKVKNTAALVKFAVENDLC